MGRITPAHAALDTVVGGIVSAVLFDFSDTLFTAYGDAEWVRRTAEQAGRPLDEEAIEVAVAELAHA